MRVWWSLPVLVVLVALAFPAPRAGLARAAAPAAAAPDSAPPRLAHDAVPTREEVELALDPDTTSYRGRVAIALEVKAATREIRFHARETAIDSVTLRGAKGAIAVAAIERLVPDQTRLRLKAPLEPGRYDLAIRFHKPYNTRAVSLYRVVTGGHSYLFTQFEDTEAREAFPCWDEPEFKFPWRVTLTVPSGDLAVSNTPVERESAAGPVKTVRFAETKPLPSYLIAIAVGPFDSVRIDGLGMPGRVITVRGAAGMAAEAVRVTPGIIRSLERYFGRPYPYEKLDLIAAPEFLYGAMENAGAIVFADRRLLIDPRSASPEQRQLLTGVIAHECAHMWFGDLVTMKWWDDLWLNESFASWMASKVEDDVNPEAHAGTTRVLTVQRAFATDSRLSTRAMRAQITGATSLGQTANELTYNKGQAVLSMFEGWLGPATFRAGVLEYLKAHAWGNAEGRDLWQALGHVSGEDIDAAMSSFLDQPGVPMVAVVPLEGGRVRLAQKRFVTRTDSPPDSTRWRIPVILRYPGADSVRTLRVWLARPDTTVALGLASAPAWIEPNAGGSGYYRWLVPDAMLDPLAAAAARGTLTPPERIDLVSVLAAQLRGGFLHGDRFLTLLARLSDDPSPEVTRAAIEVLSDTRVALGTARADSAYAAFLRATLEPALRRYGLRPDSREPEAVSLMRPSLLRALAGAGRDERVIAYAESLGRGYRRDPASVPASLAETGVLIGAMRGDRPMFDDYRRRFETTTVPNERPMYLAGMGTFRDPALRQAALDYTLTGPLRPQETLMIPGAMGSSLGGFEGRGGGGEYPDDVVAWVLDHFDQLAARMPPNFTARIIGLTGGCSAERLVTLRDYFKDPSHHVLGGDATLRRLTEAIQECSSLHARESSRVEGWLLQTPRP